MLSHERYMSLTRSGTGCL